MVLTVGSAIYSIFHVLMAFLALYLSFKCNDNKFNLVSCLVALFLPYVYIAYALAVRGGCNLLS
jgi:hypothetical protein